MNTTEKIPETKPLPAIFHCEYKRSTRVHIVYDPEGKVFFQHKEPNVCNRIAAMGNRMIEIQQAGEVQKRLAQTMILQRNEALTALEAVKDKANWFLNRSTILSIVDPVLNKYTDKPETK